MAFQHRHRDLPGVLLAVGLSLVMLLAITSNPDTAVLGPIEGQRGFYSVEDYPDARTVPGLLLFRFEADIVVAEERARKVPSCRRRQG